MQETKHVAHLCSKVHRGTVKWYDPQKSFGFIHCDDGKDVFCHQSEIQMPGFRKLTNGDIVDYSTGSTSDGRTMAVHIVPVLTVDILRKEARKCHCTLRDIKDQFGNSLWLVVDENNIIQSPETGMTLEETADFFGCDWDMYGEIIECA